MLVDHISQHVAALCLEFFSPETSPAPGDLLPDKQTELVAEFEYQGGLLVMSESDEVGAHFLHRHKRLSHHIVRNCRGHPGVILMVMGASKQEALTVDLEGTMFHPLHRANPEPL